jgi:hypothetical protein
LVEALATVGLVIFLWIAVAVLGLAVAFVVALFVCSQAGCGWEACRCRRGWPSHIGHRHEQESRIP